MCTGLGIGFPFVSRQPATAAVSIGMMYPQQGSHQRATADLLLIAAAGQGTVGVRKLHRVRVQDVGAPAFTSVLDTGKSVATAKGEALLHGH